MRNNQRLLALAALILAPAFALAQTSHVDTQNWPTKPIHLIVPYPAGGAVDSVGRVIAEKLQSSLGQKVVVENKAGASGTVGTDFVAKAAPDGHTLVVSITSSLLINQFLLKNLPYNPQRDLVMVSQIASAVIVLLAHPGV